MKVQVIIFYYISPLQSCLNIIELIGKNYTIEFKNSSLLPMVNCSKAPFCLGVP